MFAKTADLRKKKNYTLIAAFILLILISILVSLAFFQGIDFVTNRFRAASLDISLLEENYDRLTDIQKRTLIPNRTLPKDPKIKNTDKTDAFVFLKITVPVGKITYVEENGTRTTKQSQELFRIKTEQTKSITNRDTNFNTDSTTDQEYWIELTDYEEGTDYSQDTRTYVFGYSVYLKPGETTETLFDYIQLKNAVQYEADPNQLLRIGVSAYGIQADHIGDIEKGDTEKAILTAEQLTEIYSYIDDINE